MTDRNVPRATLRDLQPPARVTTALGAAPIPRFEPDHEEQTKPGKGESSPLLRLMRCDALMSSVESTALADLAEAWSRADTESRVLISALARRLGQ